MKLLNLFDFLVSCGGGNSHLELGDGTLPSVIHKVISILKIAIPILVVVFGLIDLGKAVVSAKEDDIKKNQGLLIKRIILAVIVFFVVSAVQLVIGLVGGSDAEYSGCFDCFVNGKCDGALPD